MAVRGTTQGLALTPARWATWVAQRHEWNGYLWIRWSDAEAILLFVSGRPRIHLWDGAGWVEGEHARTTVAQRLGRLPLPRGRGGLGAAPGIHRGRCAGGRRGSRLDRAGRPRARGALPPGRCRQRRRRGAAPGGRAADQQRTRRASPLCSAG